MEDVVVEEEVLVVKDKMEVQHLVQTEVWVVMDDNHPLVDICYLMLEEEVVVDQEFLVGMVDLV
jgi:hypothetical protein